jgi:NitT/TauT family transport system ATP-binding protein
MSIATPISVAPGAPPVERSTAEASPSGARPAVDVVDIGAAAGRKLVEFQGVDLAYDETSGNAIENISIDIREGEFVAIVGPSGCGKSTFMKLTSGLRPPTKGHVIVDGREVAGPLKIVGMAFQAPTLLPWRTTLDNVLLPLEIVEPYRSTFKQKKAEYAERARTLLKTVGLQGNEDKFPWQLSGGMQQRASICRALVHEPRLLLLDEPFAALDAFTREELWCVLRDLWTEKRFTVVLVTHDLREATFLADTVYVMSKRPGRMLLKKKIELPRPRDLEVTYSDEFTGIVHELREHIGRIRKT